jgi:hypothetical protein
MPQRPDVPVQRNDAVNTLVAILFAVALAGVGGCAVDVNDDPELFAMRGPNVEGAKLNRTTWDIAPPEGTPKALPEFSEGLWPCSDCHELVDPNPEKRKLEEEHDKVVLAHGINDRWCLDCHSKDNRDMLKLADGREISFEQRFRLCTQCHGEITFEWSRGVHGKRTGNWNGDKEYFQCANCHRAHDPRIAPIEPKPAPTPPAEIRAK